jgi:hypothetical protein
MIRDVTLMIKLDRHSHSIASSCRSVELPCSSVESSSISPNSPLANISNLHQLHGIL